MFIIINIIMGVLKRLKDGKTESGARCEAISWNDDGSFKEIVSNEPTVGCSFLVGSVSARTYSDSDYWLTTEVTEILERKEENDKVYIKFKTLNSIYEFIK